jgi:hypothetical protein
MGRAGSHRLAAACPARPSLRRWVALVVSRVSVRLVQQASVRGDRKVEHRQSAADTRRAGAGEHDPHGPLGPLLPPVPSAVSLAEIRRPRRLGRGRLRLERHGMKDGSNPATPIPCAATRTTGAASPGRLRAVRVRARSPRWGSRASPGHESHRARRLSAMSPSSWASTSTTGRTWRSWWAPNRRHGCALCPGRRPPGRT